MKAFVWLCSSFLILVGSCALVNAQTPPATASSGAKMSSGQATSPKSANCDQSGSKSAQATKSKKSSCADTNDDETLMPTNE